LRKKRVLRVERVQTRLQFAYCGCLICVLDFAILVLLLIKKSVKDFAVVLLCLGVFLAGNADVIVNVSLIIWFDI
jgi:hypothetical protein